MIVEEVARAMKWKTLLIISIVLCTCYAFSALTVAAETEMRLDDMQLLLENPNLAFYMNMTTAEFAVEARETGDVWYSNPINLEETETIALGDSAKRLKAQFLLEYYYLDKPQTMNSYIDSVLLDQVDISVEDSKVRVHYTVGKEYNDEDGIPLLISQERFEEHLLDKLTSAQDKKQLLDAYELIYLQEVEGEIEKPLKISLIDTDALYEKGKYQLFSPDIAELVETADEQDSLQAQIDALRVQLTVSLVKTILGAREDYFELGEVTFSDIAQLVDRPTYIYKGLSGFRQRKLLEVIKKTDYGLSDANLDRSENHLDPIKPNEAVFHIPLEYYLDGENLVVNLPVGEIGFTEDYLLTSLTLLSFFGAADDREKGYIFVPDGSGALIYLNNGKTNVNAYASRVYGDDYALPPGAKRTIPQQTYLPVFGMKHADKAFLAIIEDGDALARIKADISGRGHSFNTVYAEFLPIPIGSLTLHTGTEHGSQDKKFYQSDIYQGNITVRFAFLGRQEADYVGMASHYRGYLMQKHGLQRLAHSPDIPFYLELVGAIDRMRPIMGIPRVVREALTTFDQAHEIVNLLHGAGISNMKVRLSGWLKGGLRHFYPTRALPDKMVGSQQEFEGLLASMQDKATTIYPDVSFLNIYQDTKFDGFKPVRDAARYVTRKVGKNYEYDPASYRPKEGQFAFLLSPARLDYLIGRFLDSYRQYDLDSLSVRHMGKQLHSDFRENAADLIDRQEARDTIVGQLQRLSHEEGMSLLMEGGNAYVWPYADALLGVPFGSSDYNMIDMTVPFFQIAAHGLLDYTGKAINLNSADSRREFLESIEYGASLYYQLIYAGLSAVKGTDFSYLNSTHYADWTQQAVQFYEESKAVLGAVRGQFIIDHRCLREGVYETVYDNGLSIIVNYNEAPAVIQGVRVEGEGFRLLRGRAYED